MINWRTPYRLPSRHSGKRWNTRYIVAALRRFEAAHLDKQTAEHDPDGIYRRLWNA
jgi:hypothetical protein